MQYYPISRRGFTLVELAVVLVLSGLIITGVMAGVQLVHNSKITATLIEVEEFRIAIDNFRSKFRGLPGDLLEADRYFEGSANGDGDHLVEWSATGGEDLRAWQQLALADMIGGSYTGTRADNTPEALTTGETDVDSDGLFDDDTNLPRASFEQGSDGYNGYYMMVNTDSSLPVASSPLVSNTIRMGSRPYDDGVQRLQPAVSPIDAALIDSKMDDGYAESGLVRGVNGQTGAGSFSSCLDDEDSDTNNDDYDAGSESIECVLWFQF